MLTRARASPKPLPVTPICFTITGRNGNMGAAPAACRKYNSFNQGCLGSILLEIQKFMLSLFKAIVSFADYIIMPC